MVKLAKLIKKNITVQVAAKTAQKLLFAFKRGSLWGGGGDLVEVHEYLHISFVQLNNFDDNFVV